MALRFPRELSFLSPSGGHDALEYELFQERAATLGRLGRRLQGALDALRHFDEAHGGVELDAEQRREREALAAEAAEVLWYYVVQREVCGLTTNLDAVLTELSVPKELLVRMGCRSAGGANSTGRFGAGA